MENSFKYDPVYLFYKPFLLNTIIVYQLFPSLLLNAT